MIMKNKKILVRDIGKQSFSEAWEYQEKIFKKIINQKVQNRSKDKKIETKNFLIFTEHNHVYTIGKSGYVNNLLIDKDELSKKEIEYFKINRGGDITYHGPGQIMAYPIFDLDNFFTDINLYLRKLEEVIIHTLQSYGLTYIPGTWIESLQVAKGSGSVVNGYESISGQINAELRKPLTDDKFFINLFANQMERLELNTHYTANLNQKLDYGLYFHANKKDTSADNNNDGIVNVLDIVAIVNTILDN